MARIVGKRKVQLIGDSLLVAIPPKVWRELHIQEGDSVVFRIDYKTGKVELDKLEAQEGSAG